MAKNVKTINIKQLGKVNFTPVGTLVPFKLPSYRYFSKFSSAGDFKQSGKTLFEYYSQYSLQKVKDSIPTVQSYVFYRLKSGESYIEFARLYVNGKLKEVIEAIKTYVAVELPARVQDVINTLDSSVREQKKSALLTELSSEDFYKGIINSVITGSESLKQQVLLYLLNPQEILKMQYEYMISYDKLDGDPAMQMKEGVKESCKKSNDFLNRESRKYNCIDAINQKANSLITENKQLLESVKVANQPITDVVSYINKNLTELYNILGSANQSSANLRSQGYNLGLAMNPITKDYGTSGNKNTKSKGINLTTILLLAIPIAIFLIKKQK
ncbi:MAG: hypothetical protein UH077_03880 [Bacteroidales bacterium]|nr:hypothetical protein [Bacteroidales bacterium]